MKRIIQKSRSVLLMALCVLLTAYAHATDYDLYVDGTRVTDSNYGDILSNGAFSYDPDDAAESLVYNAGVDGLTVNIAADVTLSSKGVVNSNGSIFWLSVSTTFIGSDVLTASLVKAGARESIIRADGDGVEVTLDHIVGVGTSTVSGEFAFRAHNGAFIVLKGTTFTSEGNLVVGHDGSSGIALEDCSMVSPVGTQYLDMTYQYLYLYYLCDSEGKILGEQNESGWKIAEGYELSDDADSNDRTAAGDDGWYTISGIRLSQKPTVKGVYIHGGKKVSIK